VTDPLIGSLRKAVDVSPDDTRLRLHLVELLLGAGDVDDAIAHCATALAQDPTSVQARQLMAQAMTTPDGSRSEPQPGGFDWSAAEHQVGGIAAPMFVNGDDEPEPATSAWEVEDAGLTLADVGGMRDVKARLEAAFLAPMRNPELRQLYGKSLRGGLLLYGPPGCGKTFIARALAGELGARFVSVGLADILDMYVGSSERNIADLFGLVRREAPCVLFLDEIDALGQKRSSAHNAAMRGAVVQLLTELEESRARTKACSSLLRRTSRGTSTLRCAVRVGWTARCWSSRPMAKHGNRCSATTSGTGRWKASTSSGWAGRPRASRAPTSPTSVRRLPSGRFSTALAVARSG
jgi:hypothetical protein